MKHILPSLAITLLAALPCQAAEPSTDSATVASQIFAKACIGHWVDYDLLRDKLRPGHDLYLPQLSADQAKPFLQGGNGDAWIRPDAGVILTLWRDNSQCAVVVRKTQTDRLYRQLEQDARAVVGRAYSVRSGGKESQGTLLARFIDLDPIGEYRQSLSKTLGGEPPGLRVILTTTETAVANFQAVITIGTRQP